MRTYRHNNERSRDLGPEMCECGEMSAECWVYVTYSWGGELERHLCEECLDTLETKLRQERGVDVVVQYEEQGPMYGWGT